MNVNGRGNANANANRRGNVGRDSESSRTSLQQRTLPSSTANTFSNIVYGSKEGAGNNNCYAWAIGDYRSSGGQKLQPGDISGTTGGPMTCANLARQALADARTQGKTMRPRGRLGCGKNEYGVMLFVDPRSDYHWYRQHRHILYRVKTPTTVAALAKKFKVSKGRVTAPHASLGRVDSGLVLIRDAWVWSHKRGLSGEGPIVVDASDKVIFDPRKADRNYGDLNYRDFCGAWCRQK